MTGHWRLGVLLELNTLSLALLALAAFSYVQRRSLAIWVAAVLFFPVAGLTTIAVWWPSSPAAAVALLVATLGVSALALALFAVDVLWAPFCLEMTYLTFLCWLLCPVAVLANYVGLLLRAVHVGRAL